MRYFMCMKHFQFGQVNARLVTDVFIDIVKMKDVELKSMKISLPLSLSLYGEEFFTY
jgi:hypothetical protein